jgi:DNA-binding MarR family transcriptional regulator
MVNMVDDKDNRVDDQGGTPRPAWEMPLLLLGAFRMLVDDAHRVLAERGHPDVRPAHGFTLQALGDGATASAVAARLGVSKQAAAKTIALLEEQGYVAREPDPDDARRKLVVPTARGRDLLAQSARAFAEAVARWERTVGPDDVVRLHTTLRALAPARTPLDLASWAGEP